MNIYEVREVEDVLRETFDNSVKVKAVQQVFAGLPKNREFVIDNCATDISTALGIPLHDVLEILWTPNPMKYPSVTEGIARIGEAGSLPIIWTQGHVSAGFDIRNVRDERSLGFQPLKVVRSGLNADLCPYADRLETMGIPGLIGGSDKVSEEIVVPVLKSGLYHGLRQVVAVDDLQENLDGLGEICNFFGIDYYPVQIDYLVGAAPGSIGSFDELLMVPDALYFLDLDRTTIRTDEMKEDLYCRLAQHLPFEFAA